MAEKDIKRYNLHPFRVLTACGIDYEELNRPTIGICNCFSDIVAGHTNLRQLADFVRKGIYRAGGNALEFGTIGCCDSVGNTHDGAMAILHLARSLQTAWKPCAGPTNFPASCCWVPVTKSSRVC